jgi:hypothetical protein
LCGGSGVYGEFGVQAIASIAIVDINKRKLSRI